MSENEREINKINVGIVGLGSIAKRMHLPVLSAFEDVNIAAAADINEKEGEKVVKKWGIQGFYTNYAKLGETTIWKKREAIR